MIYFLDKKTKVIGILIVFLLILSIFNKPIKNTWISMTRPISETFLKQGNFFYDSWQHLSNMNNLSNENKELSKKIQELEFANSECKLIKEENEDLKQAMNLSIHERFNLISCNIIKKENTREFIVINRGEKDGISVGMTVITPQNVLVGKIREVYTNYSLVELLTSKDFSYNIKIKDKDIETIAKGSGSSNIFLDLITKETNISIQDIVLSTHTGGIFPEGLLIGKIQNIKREDINPFQEITVIPYYKHKDNYNLFIISND